MKNFSSIYHLKLYYKASNKKFVYHHMSAKYLKYISWFHLHFEVKICKFRWKKNFFASFSSEFNVMCLSFGACQVKVEHWCVVKKRVIKNYLYVSHRQLAKIINFTLIVIGLYVVQGRSYVSMTALWCLSTLSMKSTNSDLRPLLEQHNYVKMSSKSSFVIILWGFVGLTFGRWYNLALIA